MTGQPVTAPADPSECHDEPLRGNRDFVALLVSRSVSSGGDAVSSTALPLLVLALMGLVTCAIALAVSQAPALRAAALATTHHRSQPVPPIDEGIET